VDSRFRGNDAHGAILKRARALHPFHLTAWVFLPDHGHCIGAPVYPVAISLAMKPVKQSSMSAVNQRRGAEGELWQPRLCKCA
jgi:REP element-mobilizing transposase RayT